MFNCRLVTWAIYWAYMLNGILIDLLANDHFLQFFFSVAFPDHSLCTKIFSQLLNLATGQYNFDIVKRIIGCKEFKSYYVNTSTYSIQQFISVFIDDSSMQADISSFIKSFTGYDRVIALRLLYKHITDRNNVVEQKQYISENVNLLRSDDIIDFTFHKWLEITPAFEEKIISDTVNIYKQQKQTAVHVSPDPLQSKLDLIYLLYLTGNMSSLARLSDIEDASDFLSFFIHPDTFEYSKVDLSNYMWGNIARHRQYMDLFVAHKDQMIPMNLVLMVFHKIQLVQTILCLQITKQTKILTKVVKISRNKRIQPMKIQKESED